MERCYKKLASHSLCLLHKTEAVHRSHKVGKGENKPKDQYRNASLVYWINFFEESFLYQMRKPYFYLQRILIFSPELI